MQQPPCWPFRIAMIATLGGWVCLNLGTLAHPGSMRWCFWFTTVMGASHIMVRCSFWELPKEVSKWLGDRVPSHTRIFRGLVCTSMIGHAILHQLLRDTILRGCWCRIKLQVTKLLGFACITFCLIHVYHVFFVWYSSIILITVCHIITWLLSTFRYGKIMNLVDRCCSWDSSMCSIGLNGCSAAYTLRDFWAWWDSSANHWPCVEKNAETTITVRYKNPSFKTHHYLSQQIGFWCEFQNGIHACMAWHGMVLLYIEQYFAAQRWRSLGLQQSWPGMAGMVLLYSSTFYPS